MNASSYHVISKEVENHIFKYNLIFRDTCMIHVCIKNPHWQNSEIMIFFCKYDVVISDILVGSFLDVLYFFLTVILSELHETPRRKERVTEKVYRRICARDITFLTALPSLLFFNFLLLSLFSLPPCHMTNLLNNPMKIHYNAMVSILRDDTMSEQSKLWQSLAI